jgi:hypothetical protein
VRLISVLLLTSSALLSQSAFAQARIFCCDDAAGRKVCGDFLPKECQGRAYVERDGKGFVSRQVEAPLTPEQQARRDAELAKKEDLRKKAEEDRRRTLALLSTYSNPGDVDVARDKALAEVEKNMKESQTRLDEALKKKKKIDGEKEFYKGKVMPAQVKMQIAEADTEIKAHQTAVAGRMKEMDDIRTKFAEEKRRYMELTGKKAAASATTPATPAPTTATATAKSPATTPAPTPSTPPTPAAAKTN